MKKERIIQKLLNVKLLHINMLKTSDKYTYVWVYSMFCLQVLRFLVSEWALTNEIFKEILTVRQDYCLCDRRATENLKWV